jgi:hypothetical protein
MLSYVLTWRNVECPLRGIQAITGRSTPPPSPPPAECTETDPIDANTGAGIAGQYFDSQTAQ